MVQGLGFRAQVLGALGKWLLDLGQALAVTFQPCRLLTAANACEVFQKSVASRCQFVLRLSSRLVRLKG